METTIDEVGIQIESNSSGAISNLDKLAQSISGLTERLQSGLKKLRSFNSTIGELKAITDNINLGNIDISKLENSLGGLSTISKGTGLKSVLSQLKEFPEISKSLKTADIEEFTKNVNELTKSLKPLSEQMLIISSSFAMLPQNVTKATGAIKKLNTSVNSTKKNSWFDNLLMGKGGRLLSIGLFTAALSRLGNVIGGFVNEMNSYIENMNLFAISMGENAEEAMKFAKSFSEVLGVDISKVMQYMGDFNALGKSFGLASDKAYIMSKNLTQLAYDISSFRNISVDDAMQKIRSGFVGEIEPMRAIGVALDQASLQETAYALGINKRVNEMTRAQKTELLYYQMMKKTTYMQGDMARTLQQPANALRVLQAQFTQLARAIGSIFIPILMAIIPYVKVVINWLIALANTIASFLGFEQVDFSNFVKGTGNLSAGLGDIEDSASGVNKELNRMLAKFDDLNVIDFGKNSGSGAGVGTGGSLGIELPEYDALEGAVTQNLEKFERKLKSILPYVEAIGIGLATWKIGSSILSFLENLGVIKDLKNPLRIAAGVSIALGGLWLLYKGIEKFIEDGQLTPESLLLILGGGGITSAGLGLAFKSKIPLNLGLKLTIAVAEVLLLFSLIKWWNEYFDEQKQLIYGDKKELNLLEMIHVGFSAIGQGAVNAAGLNDAIDKFNEWVSEEWNKAKMPLNFSDLSYGERMQWGTYFQSYVIGDLFGAKDWGITKKVQTELKEVRETVSEWKQKFKEIENWWNEKVKPWFTKEKWQEEIDKGINGIEEKFNEWKLNFKPIEEWFNEKVAPWFTKEKWEEETQKAIDAIRTKFNEWKLNFKPIEEWFNEKVYPWFTREKWQNVTNNGPEGIKEKFNEWKNNYRPIEDWWNNKIRPWFTREKWQNIAKEATKAISDTFSNLNINLRTPKFSWGTQPVKESWIANTLKALNLPVQLPKLKIDWFAEGGFPEVGQLFVAREAGPELVGNIGNRAAVANNDQITEGIRQASYEGISQAMRENRGNSRQPVNVYIGNKKIYSGYGEYAQSEADMYGRSVRV